MSQVICVLILFAVTVAGGVVVVRRLRPAERAVVVLGLLAAAAQVYYPPCLQTTIPDAAPKSVGRQPLNGSLSYRPSDNGTWIDADRLTMGLIITVVITAIGCGLVIHWRPTAGQKPPPAS